MENRRNNVTRESYDVTRAVAGAQSNQPWLVDVGYHMRTYDYELGHALAAEPIVATDYTNELIPILQLS